MKKRILLTIIAIAAVAFGVVGMSAFEAHVINVTAKIENALDVSPYGIDFGTVFPQEDLDENFTIALSDSFKANGRVDNVEYKLVQKPKTFTLNFGGGDADAHNRSLLCVDPDTDNLAQRCVIGSGVLTITTDSDKGSEDLFGANETFSDVTAPRMLIPMGGNFIIETKVAANPTGFTGPDGQYQSGGIIVYNDDGDVVRLELTKWGAGTDGNNSVYMESQENRVKVGKRYTINDIENDLVYLKLTRVGNVFTGYYKEALGDAWTEVPIQEGKDDFTNEAIGGDPKIGFAAVDNKGGSSFSATFDYATLNDGYEDLCRFLSKTPQDLNDVAEPSYYVEGDTEPDSCRDVITQATGILSNPNDYTDTWNVGLKVPPVAGYIGQDWPASCASYVVPENAKNYGCDIWVEVTKID